MYKYFCFEPLRPHQRPKPKEKTFYISFPRFHIPMKNHHDRRTRITVIFFPLDPGWGKHPDPG
jgi:hypothetical protein